MSKSRLLQLREILARHGHLYYVLDQPEISDYEYDQLMQELLDLEAKYPEKFDANSPSQKVGGIVLDQFERVAHEVEMYSLNNAFDKEALETYDNRIQKSISDYQYDVEYKIDGLAISIIYENGEFVRAITRGDGVFGEDVSNNIKTINSLPLKISYPQKLEIRGEVFINKDDFIKINKQRSLNNEALFVNARNAAAGSVRQLDSKVAAQRNLDGFFYTVVNPESHNLSSQSEALEFMKKLGFKVNKHNRLLNNIDEVWEYIEYLETQRIELNYDIDGAVIKVNELSNQNVLGFTSKFPRWAIAYKFAAIEVISKIEDIFLTVGRTGKITPNAKLTPVFIDGSNVGFAQLHNEDMIIEKDIRLNDKVVVRKAGDIIPEVVRVIIDKEQQRSEKFKFPKNCPECHQKIVRQENEAHHYCINADCPAQIIESLAHFASRDAMDIKGLGERTIKTFYENNILNSIEDIYRLEGKETEILALEGFKQKSFDNLVMAINASKDRNLAQFINGLGIRQVGSRASQILSQHYHNIEDFKNLSVEKLEEIDDIGQITAQSIIDFFENDKNLEMLDNLKDLGVNPKSDILKVVSDSFFKDKTVVITGSFTGLNRKDIKAKLEGLGAKVVGSVSGNTDLLVYGEKAGSKYDQAISLGVSTMDKEAFTKEVENHEKDN